MVEVLVVANKDTTFGMKFVLNGKVTKSHHDGEYLIIDEFIVDSICPDWDSFTGVSSPTG